ncbi:ROK family transcriptional regulator [Neobacillus sp. MM2021_6]|uniref:ROK family transcriptional regulator n=1 Tax=Bacillaceae TaxID=186817 RepID=UPI0014078318|nr:MULTISPECIES: ROK family transcriptional regulator [Bacillaceae]MBO0959843.1 ROK family transcriptional regulator [Neobacillus sp. MM2021_6]NHC20509.1 ROK family transcriptional regulator [Bacillus sp. MM2020_4]
MKIIELLNDYQMNRLINFIREQGPISRVELSKRLGISQPTVTRMVEKGIQEQLVIENGLGDSSGGRRPVLLSINSTCCYSIGIEIGRSAVKMAITDLSGNMITYQLKETNNKGNMTDIISFIKERVEKMIVEEEIDRSKLLGVGIGIPGPINESQEGLVTIPNFYDIHKVPLRRMLQQAFTIPVTIDVNANVAALAEKWFGKGRRSNHFVYVMADAGIGSGIIVNGELHRGNHRESGLIGHSTVDLFGERCSCGNYGCLETLVSTTKIIKNVYSQLEVNPQEKQLFFENSENVTFEDIVFSLQSGSSVTQQVVEEAGRFLGIGVANVISFFDPEMIVIGGRLMLLGDLFLDALRNEVQARVVGSGGKNTPIMVSDLSDGVVLGAAALVINEAFSIEKAHQLV